MRETAPSASRGLETFLRWLTRSALRTTALFVALTFVPILLLTYYIVANSIRASRADADADDRQVRDLAADVLRADFSGERDSLLATADDSAVQLAVAHSRRPPGAAAQAVLARLLRRHPELAGVGLYAASGARLAQQPATLAPLLPPGPLPDWFHAAAAGAPATSALMPNAAASPSLVEAVPVATGGVLLGALPASVVRGWTGRINPGAGHYLYLLDRQGQLVSAPAAGPLTAAQAAALPAARAALSGRSGEEESRIAFASDAIAYAPLAEQDLAVLIVRPVRFRFYVYRVFYDKLAVIALIVFLLAVAGGLLLRAAFRYYLRYNREVEHGRSKTEALLGSIGDGVVAVDSAGHVIECNRAAAALTRWPAPEALGRPYREVVNLADERAEGGADPIQQAMTENRTIRLVRDLVLLHTDGSRVPVTVTAAPVRDELGNARGCVVVLSDASQEREVDRMKNEFISIASHQLRTPMSGVKGALALLMEEVLGPLNREQHDYVRRAYESNERLIALVNDLLNVSRLEQGQMQLRAEPLNLAVLLPALLGEYRARAARYGQQLRYEGPPESEDGPAPEWLVRGDPVRLREVFANLLDNAIKYTPENGMVTLRLRAAGAEVTVEVKDTGVGIPAEKMGSLFQKFNRIQNPLSGRESGTGLGLYFVRSVVELHQGRIEVESRPGEGTTFRVVLPQAAGEEAAPPRAVA